MFLQRKHAFLPQYVPANWIGYLCGFAPFGEFQWRFPLSLQIPPGVILAIGILWFLPESPRWLIQVGRYDEARKAFDQIRDDLAEASGWYT